MKKLITYIVLISYFNVKAQITIILPFIGTNGANPECTLFFDGTFLYGTTSVGGTFNDGNIFKVKPDGTGYSTLMSFNDTNGLYPKSLISDGVFLYGITSAGGLYGFGTVFKIKPDGSSYSRLFDFNGFNGQGPSDALFYDGVFLYGVTGAGGANNNCTGGCGVIFKIKPDGTGFTKLYDFDYTNGSQPEGSLISDGTFLYGTANSGGVNGIFNAPGVIFKIKPDGTGFTKLHVFNDSTEGVYPVGKLFYDGTFLYGATCCGGLYNGVDEGTIFKIKPDGTSFTTLYDFTSINGRHPVGALISDGTYLYGITNDGGINYWGVIYKIKPDGTGYTKLYDFDFLHGANPHASLIYDGNFLYGTTYTGTYNLPDPGLVFKLCISPPKVLASSSQLEVCSGIKDTLNVSGASTYTWSNGSTDTSIVIAPSVTTQYVVRGDINGCADTDTITVLVKKCVMAAENSILVVPNIFTPNGDGINDVFQINENGIYDFTCSIFDRWGILVYQWTDLNAGWSGKDKNGECSEGIYYYLITYNSNNSLQSKKGFLTLLR